MCFQTELFTDNLYYMSNDPRLALNTFINALEEHLTAIVNRRGDYDPAVDHAYVAVANAFERYEEVLFDQFEEVTPLEVYIDDADEDEDEDDIEYDDPTLEAGRQN